MSQDPWPELAWFYGGGSCRVTMLPLVFVVFGFGGSAAGGLPLPNLLLSAVLVVDPVRLLQSVFASFPEFVFCAVGGASKTEGCLGSVPDAYGGDFFRSSLARSLCMLLSVRMLDGIIAAPGGRSDSFVFLPFACVCVMAFLFY